MQKLINFDVVSKEDIKEYNWNRPQIPDHPYRILIIGGSGSGKINSYFNVIIHQPVIDKIHSMKFIYMLKTHIKENINF